MHSEQTAEQSLLREAAAAVDPRFATLEGRALEDVRRTIAYLAIGRRPRTVLGGLMINNFELFDSAFLEDHDRDAIEIGVRGRVDTIEGPNELGDYIEDTLEGLVQLGFVEYGYQPGTVEALSRPADDHRRKMNRPTYRLARQSMPPAVANVIDIVAQEKTDRASERNRPSRPLLRRNKKA